ncbi:MAG: hypothetical protein RJA10_1818 [Pseudomonadota bacterium]
MAVALLLPGVMPVARAQATVEDGADLQAAVHRDGARPTGSGAPSPRALQVQRLTWRGQVALDGRHTLQIGALQDTWSGATPVAVAPAVAGGNRAVQQGPAGALVVVGASPWLEGRVWVDAQGQPLARGADGRFSPAPQLAHTLSSASPETRRQLDLKLTRRADNGHWALGAGVSQERDHRAHFASLMRRVDDGLSTWTVGANATRSHIAAVLDHDALPYLDKTLQADRLVLRNGQTVHQGTRHEWGASLGFTRVLGPAALLDATLSVSQARGDLDQPYKAVSVIFAPPAATAGEPVEGDLRALLERRPDARRQWNAGTRLVLHHAASDGALHLGAGGFGDDWGVRGSRLSAEWFQPLAGDALLSARVAHHSQTAAHFYTPGLVSGQAYRLVTVLPDGRITTRRFDPALLPPVMSSDTRLAAFGALSLGLGHSRPLGRGVVLDLSVERSWQSGRFKWGGGGEGRWADLQHWTMQASLRMPFEAGGSATPAQAHTHHPHHAQAAPAPAGVMGAHAAPGPGRWMLGLRLGGERWGGPWQQGSRRLDDAEAAATGCNGTPCAALPSGMAMRMAMLELMVGLGQRHSLMLMAPHMTHTMHSALVPGAAPRDVPVHTGRHEHGGTGDVQLHLQRHGGHPTLAWTLGLGLSAPTGRADASRRRAHQQGGALVELGMQTGSGCWELLPSATLQGTTGRLGWGARLSAATRLQAANDAGYARGLRWQAEAWAGTALGHGFGTTARLAWRVDHGVAGAPRNAAAEAVSPAEVSAQLGGRVAEAGLGLSAALDAQGGAQRGHLALERVLPLHAWTRGVQLAPRGQWLLAWSHAL